MLPQIRITIHIQVEARWSNYAGRIRVSLQLSFFIPTSDRKRLVEDIIKLSNLRRVNGFLMAIVRRSLTDAAALIEWQQPGKLDGRASRREPQGGEIPLSSNSLPGGNKLEAWPLSLASHSHPEAFCLIFNARSWHCTAMWRDNYSRWEPSCEVERRRLHLMHGNKSWHTYIERAHARACERAQRSFYCIWRGATIALAWERLTGVLCALVISFAVSFPAIITVKEGVGNACTKVHCPHDCNFATVKFADTSVVECLASNGRVI